MDRRGLALAWLRAVPTADRVLVVRADGLATPATAWELDRRKTARAILEATPGSTALNLTQNIEFARGMQRRSGALSGEIVYSGPARISAREANDLNLPTLPSLRVIALDDPVENSGLRSVGARRSETTPEPGMCWCGCGITGARAARSRDAELRECAGGHASAGYSAGGERRHDVPVAYAGGGVLEVRLYPADAFAGGQLCGTGITGAAHDACHGLFGSARGDSTGADRGPEGGAGVQSRAQYTAAGEVPVKRVWCFWTGSVRSRYRRGMWCGSIRRWISRRFRSRSGWSIRTGSGGSRTSR